MPQDKAILNPTRKMSTSKRAQQMWAVHPTDLDRLGFKTRIEFYEAHLNAAVRDARPTHGRGDPYFTPFR